MFAYSLTMNAVKSRAGSHQASSMAEMKRIVDAPAVQTYTATGETKAAYNGHIVLSAIRVYHKAPGKHRIEYIGGQLKGLVVVDDGARTWRLDPKCKSVMAADTRVPRSNDQLRLLVSNYEVERTSGGMIAGRHTHLLTISTKSAGVRKRIWLDDKTSIVLKSEEYAPDGKLLSSTAFKTIGYKASIADSLFREPSGMQGMGCFQGTGKAMSRDELSKEIGFQVVMPKYVPQGFRLDAYRLFSCPCQCGHKSAYIRYTNGMDSISVFETPAGTGCMKTGRCGMHGGGCSVHDQTAMMTADGKSFIVIGNVNPHELRRITDSLR